MGSSVWSVAKRTALKRDRVACQPPLSECVTLTDRRKEERRGGRGGSTGWRTERGQGRVRSAAPPPRRQFCAEIVSEFALGWGKFPEGMMAWHLSQLVITSELHGGHEREHYWSEKEGRKEGTRAAGGRATAGGAKRAYQTTPVAK